MFVSEDNFISCLPLFQIATICWPWWVSVIFQQGCPPTPPWTQLLSSPKKPDYSPGSRRYTRWLSPRLFLFSWSLKWSLPDRRDIFSLLVTSMASSNLRFSWGESLNFSILATITASSWTFWTADGRRLVWAWARWLLLCMQTVRSSWRGVFGAKRSIWATTWWCL